MEANQTVSSDAIARDFSKSMEGKLEEAKIESAVKALAATTSKFPANGSVASFIFYLEFQVKITSPGGKTFNGKAGGLTSPGGGALFGDVYTDDINRMYENTKSFQFNCTPVYTSLLFFDGHSNLLGHFQSGSVSTVLGVGGGSGSWK